MTFRKNSSEVKVGQEGGEVNFDAYGKRALIRVLKRLRSRQVVSICSRIAATRSFGHMIGSERTVRSFVLILNPGI